MTDLPDYSIMNYPARTRLGQGQTRYMVTAAGTVTSGGTASFTISPSSGTQLTAGYISYTCDKSLIQEVQYYINSTLLLAENWDLNGKLEFADNAAYVFNYGESLTITLKNNDTASRNMRINVAGTIEEV